MTAQKKTKGKMPKPQSLSMLGLVKRFRKMHNTMPDRNFRFILGAGASVTSGIKSATSMVKVWINTIYGETTNLPGDVPDDWASDETLGITGFDAKDPAGSYSALYRRMFEQDPDAGYAYLEDEMKKAEPSFGYCVLGRILSETRHRVVITVNFDNLVADSVSLFSQTYPLVCGHELLAPFVTHKLRRPLVLKVHRDLLLGPMSTEEEIQKIDPGFRNAIGRLLKNYTPIVVGYGGNDGSLMSCLEDLPENTIPGGIYWCYWEGGDPPNERIQQVIAKHRGCLIPIMGFDELLMQFGNELDYDVPDKFVFDRAEKRAARIVEQAKELEERIKKSQAAAQRTAKDGKTVGTKDADAVTDAMSDTMKRQDAGKRWWQWDEEARSEPDANERDAIYREAITQLPDSPELLCNYANFLTNIRKDYDTAETIYKRVLAVYPNDADILGNYANFLTDVRKEHDTSEAMYKRALAIDPRNASKLANYASFLTNAREEHDAAEDLYKRALEFDPEDPDILGMYGDYLTDIRRDHEAAEDMYKRAIRVDSNNVNNLNFYANFLTDIRKDHAAAEAMYERAIEVDPDNADLFGNYARLLLISDKPDEGVAMLNKAIVKLEEGKPSEIDAECWMYAFCCAPAAKRKEALSRLKGILLQTDVRTGDWDFSGVIAQAKKMKHPQAKWLPRLAEVLADREGPDVLDEWTVWKNAKPK